MLMLNYIIIDSLNQQWLLYYQTNLICLICVINFQNMIEIS